jgi:predicted transglutaminase-like cysteine proteinase
MVTKPRPFAFAALASVGCSLLVPANAAQANVAAAMLMAQPMTAVQAAAPPVTGAAPCAAEPASWGAASASAKSVAILGGAPSALDQMRAKQGGGLSLVGPVAASVAKPLQPAAVGIALPAMQPCRSGAGRGQGIAATDAILRPDDFLASRRVALGRTQFDRQWRKVSRERVGGRAVRRALAEVAKKDDRIAAINAYVNRTITYTEDRDLFGKADFWAGAHRTMALGKGDCEDIAITKMHLLLASGFRREDLVLTLARDTVRRADHALLMVRRDTGWVMLDNGTDTVLDGRPAYGYRPVLSLGSKGAWLHGT